MGDADIFLEGTNTVKGGYEDYPGINAPEGKTLTIDGTGSLDASSNGAACGIGGGPEGSCGNITISDTVTQVTATKGTGASYSIGAGNGGTCGTVTITDGANVIRN